LIFVASHNDREKDKKGRVWLTDPDNEPSSEAPHQESEEAPGAPSGSDQVQKLLAEKQELMDTLVRRQADFENFRKRVERDRDQDRHRGVESLIEHILPALDAFERALAAKDDSAGAEYRKGFELIRKQLSDALAKQGLKRIESVGTEFNPHFHHAIERVETSEYPEGTVVSEMQTGYLFHDRVLRPAMVRVATAPEPHSAHAGRRDH
jgi:molecular chaperone GrpE